MRPTAWAPSATCANVQVYVTSDDKIWLVNRTTEEQSLEPGELFGFNLGSFEDIPAGRVHVFGGGSENRFQIHPNLSCPVR